MDFFDRHKALIITCLFCSVLLLALYNLSLSSKNAKERELLVDLENFQIEEQQEEEEEEPEPQEEQVESRRPTAQTHQAFNENNEAREENFDRQLDEIFNKNSVSQPEHTGDASSTSQGNYNFQKQQKAVKKRSDGNNSSTATSTKSGGMDNSSISFSLLGRSARFIPNPVYTCDTPGKIVVNITVNQDGRVISTSLNKASSTSSNECISEQAMEYAAQALFSRLPGRTSQLGTITYNFKP